VALVGRTGSDDFPLPAGAWDATLGGPTDAFIAWLSHDLSTLRAASCIGGDDGGESANAMVVEEEGWKVFIAGDTWSSDFPTTEGAFDGTYNTNDGRTDAFVAAFDLVEEGPPVIESYFLPKRVDVLVDARRPARSSLNTGGWFDTGPEPIDFSLPCRLTIGPSVFDIPGLEPWRGGWWRYQGDGIDFVIRPSRVLSSKAKFKLKFRGEPVAQIPRDAPLTLRYENGGIDTVGRVVLRRGRFKLGAVRGDLLAPALALYSCRATLRGEGRDDVRTRFGLATGQGAPDEAPDFSVTVADMEETVPGAVFTRKGEKFVFLGQKPGVTRAQVDYAKEKLTLNCGRIDAGQFAEGPQPVLLVVRLGGQELALRVRMVRMGTLMLY
jgi:hypothetical protein